MAPARNGRRSAPANPGRVALGRSPVAAATAFGNPNGPENRKRPSTPARPHAPTVTVAFDGTIKSASPSVTQVFGWKPSELIGRNIRVLIAQPHRSLHAGHLRRVARTSPPAPPIPPRRFDAQHKNGSVFPIELRFRRSTSPRDASMLLVGTIRHLGRHTPQELAEARGRLAGELSSLSRLQNISTRLVSHGDPRILFNHILDAAISITKADGGMLHLLDAESGELTLEAHRGLGPKPERPRSRERFTLLGRAAALRRGKRILVRDPGSRPVFAGPTGLPTRPEKGIRGAQFTPLMSRTGQFLGTLSTHFRDLRRCDDREMRFLDVLAREAADFIERTRSGQELLRSEAQHRAIINTAADAILTIDARGIIQSANSATERLFGYRADEMIGREVGMLMPPPHAEAHGGHIAAYLRTGIKKVIGFGREVTALRRDGTAFKADLAVSEVIPGKLFAGAMRDLTERKLAEARARQADRMASIGTLAAGLGHDMNNVLLPVRARLNALRAAATAGRIPEAERSHLDGIRKSIAYLQQLADGLHFLAMDPDQSDSSDTYATTDLRTWWLQAGPLLSRAVPKHVRVVASFPQDLPQASVAPHGLSQAILNLVVNAGAAIPVGRTRRQGRIRIWADSTAPDRVRIGVTDNGTGMSEEVKRRAFELFFTTKPRGLGTGLGLPLVRQVAERAGGSVAIESQLGHGTSVILTLPASAPGTAEKHGQVPAVPTALLTLKDGRIASVARQLLEASGVRVQNGGKTAETDVWVIDPHGVSSREAREWRRRHPHGRLILFGRPDHKTIRDWDQARPVMIDKHDDLDELRRVLTKVAARA